MKGSEVTGTEATEAIADCEEAARLAETAAVETKNFLKAKLADVQNFPEASRDVTAEELEQLQMRVEAVSQKVSAFKRETLSRKTSMLLAEVTSIVLQTEAAVRKTMELAVPPGHGARGGRV